MAYNNGCENRKWLIWKEAKEKLLREHGVDKITIEQICIDDRADFNSNRRFYHWTSDFGECLEGMAEREKNTELKTVADLLDEIEDEILYRALLTVDRRTLQIILLKMSGLWMSPRTRKCGKWNRNICSALHVKPPKYRRGRRKSMLLPIHIYFYPYLV